MHIRRKARFTAIIAAAGTVGLTVLGTAGVASAAPAYGYHHHHHFRGPCVQVQERTSGDFSNNQDILYGWIVPGSVSVVATQGSAGNNPPVDTFGLNTGYTVSPDWHTVTLQSPYAGSNDGFVTYYAVFTRSHNFWRFGCRHFRLVTYTSGAFSNNQDILLARNIVYGSVYVVATQGQSPGYDNPSVNGFNNPESYTVS